MPQCHQAQDIIAHAWRFWYGSQRSAEQWTLLLVKPHGTANTVPQERGVPILQKTGPTVSIMGKFLIFRKSSKKERSFNLWSKPRWNPSVYLKRLASVTTQRSSFGWATLSSLLGSGEIPAEEGDRKHPQRTPPSSPSERRLLSSPSPECSCWGSDVDRSPRSARACGLVHTVTDDF